MPYDIKLDDFDHLKSVTVSAQGIITVIRGSDLLSIDTKWVFFQAGSPGEDG